MICQTFEVLHMFQNKKEKKVGYERFCSLSPHTNKILIRIKAFLAMLGLKNEADNKIPLFSGHISFYCVWNFCFCFCFVLGIFCNLTLINQKQSKYRAFS